jgi:hypothetical protein
LGVFLLSAQVPQLINYQGFLKDYSGQSLEQVKLEFRIYNVATGGTAMWSEVHNQVNVNNGIFNVLLGSVESSLAEIFQTTGLRFLEIVVNDNALPKRFQITSVAYAIKSGHADLANDVASNAAVKSLTASGSGSTLTGDVTLTGGTNITLQQSGNEITITADAGAGSGDIEAVHAGPYITGGGVSGEVTLSLDRAAVDTVYVNHGEANSIMNGMIQNNAVTSAKILDGTIGTGDLGNDIITTDKIPSRAIQETDLNDAVISEGKIQNNAVTAAKIMDEPGIAYKQVNGLFSLVNTGYTYAIDSISITAPANGFIVAGSNGYVNLNHGTTADNICFEVQDTYSSTDGLFGAGCSSFTIPSALPTSTSYRYSFCTKKVFSVTSGSTTDIYLLVRQYSGSNPTDTAVYDYNIIATFYPTQY